MEINSPASFSEVQRFNQPWLWAIVIISDLFALFIGYMAISSPKTGQADYFAVACTVGFSMVLPIVILVLSKLTVEVRGDLIHLRFAPFHRTPRIFEIAKIRSAEPITYRPIAEYGGWGLRKNRAGDWIYNTSGNGGVLLTFDDGLKVTIGSQRPAELARAIAQYINKR